jgi:hypothetical protein
MDLAVNRLLQHQPEHTFCSGADEKSINTTCSDTTARSIHKTVDNRVKQL